MALPATVDLWVISADGGAVGMQQGPSISGDVQGVHHGIYVWGATNVAERAGSTPSARLESPSDRGLKTELTTGERIVGAGLRRE